MAPMNDSRWTAAKAVDLYNLPYWGEGYFSVSDNGHVVVRPYREHSEVAIDLYALAKRLPAEGLQLPVLLRFVDILHDRVDALTGAFASVIEELGYGGRYTAVYPIKVNQQGDVIEEIVRDRKSVV
jgi:arginine decarboxylase